MGGVARSIHPDTLELLTPKNKSPQKPAKPTLSTPTHLKPQTKPHPDGTTTLTHQQQFN
jgi:hypothetical protein